MSRRTERISEQLRSEIARVLSVEVTDPRIRFVTLTRIDLAPDLSRAVVYWSAIETGESALGQVEAGLRSAASFVRGRLARVLPLRRVPELHFRHDRSLALGDETLALLKSLSIGSETGSETETEIETDIEEVPEGSNGEPT